MQEQSGQSVNILLSDGTPRPDPLDSVGGVPTFPSYSDPTPHFPC